MSLSTLYGASTGTAEATVSALSAANSSTEAADSIEAGVYSAESPSPPDMARTRIGVRATMYAALLDDARHLDVENAKWQSFENRPVWHTLEDVAHLQVAHEKFRLRLKQSSDWTWWRRWYEQMWHGTFTDWDFALKVAKIDWDAEEGESVWDQGVAAVAERIEALEAEYLLSKSPMAERLEFEAAQGKFSVRPIDISKPDLLAASLSQVADALEDVLADQSNGVQQSSREVRELGRLQTRYANDPQRIEMGFVSVHKSLFRQVLVSKDLPASEENLALMDAIEESAKAIRATHPDVAENRRIINQQTLRELPAEGREVLEAALPVLVAISDDDLAAEWQADIPQLINDATTPLPSGAPPLPGMDESVRVFNRAAKISLRLRTKEVVDRIKATPEYGIVEITLSIAGLVALGLSLLS